MLWRRKNFLISMFKKENYSLVFFIIYLDIADISAFFEFTVYAANQLLSRTLLRVQ